ncbi:MAG: hypothetical protein P4L41_04060 [Flavipsychrobacter sp.]|nr:hypothetical protein [Flavipsychrobacter sp.]
MIEVFKTNVDAHEHACMLVERIHASFAGYRANFDLEDCDRILRVLCNTEAICPHKIIDTLQQYGYCATILTDDVEV